MYDDGQFCVMVNGIQIIWSPVDVKVFKSKGVRNVTNTYQLGQGCAIRNDLRWE